MNQARFSLLLLTGCLSWTYADVYGQTYAKKLLEGAIIRRSIQEANLKSKPAEAAFFYPTDASSYVVIDAAVGVTPFLPGNRSRQRAAGRPTNAPSNLLAVEFHRNSGIKKPQNVFQVGYSLEGQTNRYFNVPDTTIGLPLDAPPLKNRSQTLLYNVTAKYSNDYQTRTESAQVIAEFSVLQLAQYSERNSNGQIQKHQRRLAFHNFNKVSDKFAFSHALYTGTEFEQRFQAKEAANEGSIWRGVVKYRLNFYIGERLSIFGNGDYRYDLVNTTTYSTRHHPLLDTGIEIRLTGSTRSDVNQYVTAGISYKNGDNPIEALARSEYVLLTVRVRH